MLNVIQEFTTKEKIFLLSLSSISLLHNYMDMKRKFINVPLTPFHVHKKKI